MAIAAYRKRIGFLPWRLVDAGPQMPGCVGEGRHLQSFTRAEIEAPCCDIRSTSACRQILAVKVIERQRRAINRHWNRVMDFGGLQSASQRSHCPRVFRLYQGRSRYRASRS